jgi:hypothetical protein
MILNKVRLIIAGVATVVIIGLVITIAILGKKLSSLEEDLSYASANEKALLLKNDSNKNQIRSLQLTVEQLDYFNDSILEKLKETQRNLKIKDKNLKELQYMKTSTTKTDTVLLTDTIFVESACIDTVIGDEWVKTHLEMSYPNTIVVTPEVTSEKVIIAHLKKETVNPPKKCWLARLFQKKHKVIVVEVEEKNPYMTTKEYRHVEIIK